MMEIRKHARVEWNTDWPRTMCLILLFLVYDFGA